MSSFIVFESQYLGLRIKIDSEPMHLHPYLVVLITFNDSFVVNDVSITINFLYLNSIRLGRFESESGPHHFVCRNSGHSHWNCHRSVDECRTTCLSQQISFESDVLFGSEMQLSLQSIQW